MSNRSLAISEGIEDGRASAVSPTNAWNKCYRLVGKKFIRLGALTKHNSAIKVEQQRRSATQWPASGHYLGLSAARLTRVRRAP